MSEFVEIPKDLKKRELIHDFKSLVFELTSWAENVSIIELSDNRSQVGEIKRKEVLFRKSMKSFMDKIEDIRRELDGPKNKKQYRETKA